MTATLAPESPLAPDTFARTLAAFRSRGRMDMAFGGRTLTARPAIEISALCGARTRSLNRLVVHSGTGLGGKALALGRPVSVNSYHQAQGITHHFDAQVRDEALETVVALPVIVEGRSRMVIYLGSRTQVGLGDRWFDDFVPLVRRLERDISVDDEVARRMALLATAAGPRPPSGLSRADLVDISRELADLAASVDDEAVRARIEHVRHRFDDPSPRPAPTIALAPREVSVLEQVAAGCSNREAAENLGLLTSTVKSYLKTAMRKLQASNRVQAITAARDAGLID